MLTELEGCVLGVVWRRQPCTAYQVRMAFQGSITTSWRASTGSIYPLIRKLVGQGLASSENVEGDRRGARLLRVTSGGEAALRAWLADRASWIGEPVADPTRTRFYLLDLAPEAERARMLRTWSALTRSAMERVEANIARFMAEGDATEVCAHRGTLMQLEARLRWLESIPVASPSTGGGG